ncbi:NADH:flavin oxidoreductase [Clostridium aminobutyricum]|uniref:NADH:flavin oxidoreductase n=1 Tax=Clostridium aminobutyricum TaxID=33953 RepID=A0A939D6Q2_CLOAM|nr:NADH:flavin oxidoreductase [Clostridium aminobutyricum]MBN7771848.1 NADH:flavin oxidoreductase [Clostridium aminobutyricum]
MVKLNIPLSTPKFTLKNRLAFPPIATGKADAEGHLTPELLSYYREKSADGCFGLIIVEHSYISSEGKARGVQLSAANDTDLDGLSRLADAIRENGSFAVLQINHGGSACADCDHPMIAPSAVINPFSDRMPRAMTHDDIRRIIDLFAAAARRAQKAGFDAVEIHSAHAYLLNQFYSPLTNYREDAYGGSLENRVRLHREVIHAVRQTVGEAYPIFMRLGACDYLPGGNTTEDGAQAAALLEQAGVDFLDVSGGFCRYTIKDRTLAGYFSDSSIAIRSAVQIPVMLTGGVTTGQEAEALLEQNAADVIGVGRKAMADSGWARRALDSLQ